MVKRELPGSIGSREVSTPRLRTHLLESGPEEGVPVLFVHGNVASSRFFEETLAALPPYYRGLAPDLRGFGRSEPKPVDATRGMRDLSDDLHDLMRVLGHANGRKVHLVGWSLGGGVVMQYAIDCPEEVASLTLSCPIPPYGMGGTKDICGTPCWPDYAGSGGGLVNPDFVRFLEQGLADDPREPDNPSSPRHVMNTTYFKPPFRLAREREKILVSEILRTKVGNYNYPGDKSPSPNWPNVAPGRWGIVNAFSPKYCDLSAFAEIDPRPDVLWVRGADDRTVSDTSAADFGYLGKIGLVPGWPGEEVYPPQPMVSQIRALLKKYSAGGGSYREEVIADCGHTPHIENPDAFRGVLTEFLP
ncbi:MAG: alpha/beta hydrolase [Actinomycetota bacterium]|nr:alpha/beta hydrolase [Actinomycetota bacterium]